MKHNSLLPKAALLGMIALFIIWSQVFSIVSVKNYSANPDDPVTFSVGPSEEIEIESEGELLIGSNTFFVLSSKNGNALAGKSTQPESFQDQTVTANDVWTVQIGNSLLVSFIPTELSSTVRVHLTMEQKVTRIVILLFMVLLVYLLALLLLGA